MKLVLLSSVAVPLASSGRLMIVASAPTVSAMVMIAPPCAVPPLVQKSVRTGILATTRSCSALTTTMPMRSANGIFRDLILSSGVMRAAPLRIETLRYSPARGEPHAQDGHGDAGDLDRVQALAEQDIRLDHG